ncbi:hypothetical protein A7E78_01420 [Syntrophotalea acetylenivorans]|uniref:Uncharacterized protein n=1 Tax=Syntrophotalea acetylenivorans TaxID=1842532 RepID=A0A1L3GL11_9BACT|nr:lipopolysaccharide kinase InaA family protein [Syntrophotalea acetylenivorans]APG26637.1 hypothetical protein A7E78_01420 [Syntrophotalea acetylenivorans]
MGAEISLRQISWDYLTEDGESFLGKLENDLQVKTVIKDYPKRRVVSYPGLFMKEVRYRGTAVLFKTILGGTACKEGRISRRLFKLGIAAPEVLGYGVEKRNGILTRDVLLTKEVENSKSLYDTLLEDYPRFSVAKKCHFNKEFASFVRKLHDNGVFHNDPHMGNILFVNDPRNPHFVILDTDRVDLKNRALSQKERIANLALFHTLGALASRSEFFRFIKAYGFSQIKNHRKLILRLQKKALSHSKKIWRKNSRRSLSNNSRFCKENLHGFSIFRQRTSETANILKTLLPDPDQILEQGEIFKDGRTVRAAKIHVNGMDYFLKRYNVKGWKYCVRNAFRRSRSIKTWLSFWEFRLRRLPVPEPLLCLEERRFRLLGRSYILSEFIEGSEKLSKHWPMLDQGKKKSLLVKLGILFGRMHLFGCLHGDLKWDNILLQNTGEKSEVILIDLDGTRVRSHLRDARARRDIERFLRDLRKWASDEDVQFFLKSWQRWRVR